MATHRVLALAAAAMLAAACGSTATPSVVNVTPAPTVTPTSAPQATAAPPASVAPNTMPAELEAQLCIVLDHSLATGKRLADLSAAMDALDLDAIGLAAARAQSDAHATNAALDEVPEWTPESAHLVSTWRQSNTTLIDALEEIEAGADELDPDAVERGTRRIRIATDLLQDLNIEISALTGPAGLDCD